MDIIDNIHKEEAIKEASYAGNIGFVEMVQFYQKATAQQIKQMESLVKKNSWIGVKKLFKNVLGVQLM
jgi:hypothetical protein